MVTKVRRTQSDPTSDFSLPSEDYLRLDSVVLDLAQIPAAAEALAQPVQQLLRQRVGENWRPVPVAFVVPVASVDPVPVEASRLARQ